MLQRCIINIIETGRKYPLPGVVYMFVYNDSHISLNPQ